MKIIIIKSEDVGKDLETIFGWGIPELFNKELLNGRGFEKPDSILYINLFTELGLIDENARPTSAYVQLVKSKEHSRAMMADLVKQTYSPIFELDSNAHTLPDRKVYSLFREKMGAEKSDTLIRLVGDTFLALVNYADWTAREKEKKAESINRSTENNETIKGEARTPREEFILELMNGVDEHSYGNVAATAKGMEAVNGFRGTDRKTGTEKSRIKQEHEVSTGGAGRFAKKTVKTLVSEALIRKAALLSQMGRTNEAVQAYDEIINCFETNPIENEKRIEEAYYHKARVLEKSHQLEKALATYDVFIERYG